MPQKNLRRPKVCCHKANGLRKQVLWLGYADYSRNAFFKKYFWLRKVHIANYPADRKYTLCPLPDSNMLL